MQSYDAWRDAVQQLQAMPSTMHWVARGDTEYLSIKIEPSDSGTTHGKRGARFPAGNEETEDFDLAWCRAKFTKA